ncbi:50S ribosomal protein L32 [Candidatus Wolfebacteria bacterium]|nr:50S ribosomal protein L32 [Candidatus Wolfebacteria bacterium]
MGGVPVKHHTSSKVGRRRSHLALKKTAIFVCPKCGSPILPHRVCPKCGAYKGKVVKKPKLRVKK